METVRDEAILIEEDCRVFQDMSFVSHNAQVKISHWDILVYKTKDDPRLDPRGCFVL